MQSMINWKKSVFKNIRSDLNNKIYLLGILILTVAAYGFTFAHFSLGIDDFGFRYYLDFSSDSFANMIQQGRLLHVIFYYLSGLIDVVPFLNNFISALLMASSGVLLNGIFSVATDNKFGIAQKLFFFGLYISYPIIAFKFIYDLDVVVTSLSYACVAVAVIFGFEFIETKRVSDCLVAALFAFIAIGSYETFNSVYICTVLFVFILLCVFRGYESKAVFLHGLILAGILVASLTVYYGAVKIVQTVTDNPAYARYNIFVSEASKIDIVKNIFKKLFNPDLLFTVEFAVCVIAFILLIFYFIFKKKRPILLLLGVGFGAFLIATNIIQGNLHYRACQSFNLFIAGTALLLSVVMNDRKFLRYLCSTVLTVLLLLQLKDINIWFYNDWANYQKNVYAIHNIATDLYSGYSVESKAICFVNRDYESFLMSWDDEIMQVEIGESPIVSSIRFLGDTTSDATFQLFEYQEYEDLIHPTAEQVEKALEYSKQMPSYPEEGYIEELEDIIVVNMGKAD